MLLPHTSLFTGNTRMASYNILWTFSAFYFPLLFFFTKILVSWRRLNCKVSTMDKPLLVSKTKRHLYLFIQFITAKRDTRSVIRSHGLARVMISWEGKHFIQLFPFCGRKLLGELNNLAFTMTLNLTFKDDGDHWWLGKIFLVYEYLKLTMIRMHIES